jgi:putative transposase
MGLSFRGLTRPVTIKTDKGSEFINKMMDKLIYERGVELDFSRLGKPTENAIVESINARLRQECLIEDFLFACKMPGIKFRFSEASITR